MFLKLTLLWQWILVFRYDKYPKTNLQVFTSNAHTVLSPYFSIHGTIVENVACTVKKRKRKWHQNKNELTNVFILGFYFMMYIENISFYLDHGNFDILTHQNQILFTAKNYLIFWLFFHSVSEAFVEEDKHR